MEHRSNVNITPILSRLFDLNNSSILIHFECVDIFYKKNHFLLRSWTIVILPLAFRQFHHHRRQWRREISFSLSLVLSIGRWYGRMDQSSRKKSLSVEITFSNYPANPWGIFLSERLFILSNYLFTRWSEQENQYKIIDTFVCFELGFLGFFLTAINQHLPFQ